MYTSNSCKVCFFFCTSVPDVLIGHHKSLAEGLRTVEPDSGVLLHGSRQLARDGGAAGVQGAGNGRQERFIRIAWADPCSGGHFQTLHDLKPRHATCSRLLKVIYIALHRCCLTFYHLFCFFIQMKGACWAKCTISHKLYR